MRALSSADPEAFNAAIDEAKAEGNLSRANVVQLAVAEVEQESRTADLKNLSLA